MTKTIKRWFELISDDYIRESALTNLQNYNNGKNAEVEVDSLSEALLNGFPHSSATIPAEKELDGYWAIIEERAFKGEIEMME